MRYLLAAVVPLVIIVGLTAEPIINTLYGSEFAKSIIVLQILIISMAPFVFITIGDFILLSSYNQTIDFKLNILAVSYSSLLQYVFSYFYGAVGTAAALLGSMVTLWNYSIFLY